MPGPLQSYLPNNLIQKKNQEMLSKMHCSPLPFPLASFMPPAGRRGRGGESARPPAAATALPVLAARPAAALLAGPAAPSRAPWWFHTHPHIYTTYTHTHTHNLPPPRHPPPGAAAGRGAPQNPARSRSRRGQPALSRRPPILLPTRRGTVRMNR